MKSFHLFVIIAAIAGVLGAAVWIGTQQKCFIAYRNSPVLIVGTNATFPPFTFLKDNQIVGFDIDIAKEVGKRLCKTIDLKDMSFDALIPELLAGAVHFAAAGFTPTPERAKQVPFSTIYFSGEPLIIITPINKPAIKKLADLKGKTAIVNLGFTSDTTVSAVDGIDVLRLDTVAEALLALNMGRGTAFVTTKSVLDDYLKKNPGTQFNITPIDGSNETCALAISPEYQDLIDPINHALEAMKRDGTINQLKNKWGLKL